MNNQTPLPERMRPQVLENFVGQQHLLAKGKVIYQMIQSGNLVSMLFWGPPGVGKTSLARFIATKAKLPFYQLSAIDAGVKEVRKIIEVSESNGKAVLFIDEIHRFNKAQQDALLGAVEKGTIVLIGATTENPSFEVISALLSRCQVYVLHSLEREELETLIVNVIKNDEFLSQLNITVKETEALLKYSGGDARKLLNVLELVIQSIVDKNTGTIEISNAIVEEVIQQKMAIYDKSGEMHYDIISAFIKSMRGSDPNAALYYLARMLEGGEDPKFIARRMLILASEDIGNANPNALLLATSCFQAVTMIGFPECDLILSQTVIYLASSVKSNSCYTAIRAARQIVRQTGDLPVPLHLRNAPTALMKQLNYGNNYRYAHDFTGNFIEQEFLPESIKGKVFYNPGENSKENEIRKILKLNWKEKYDY